MTGDHSPNWDWRELSSLMVTFQRNGPQVLEKDILGALSWQEADLVFKRFTDIFKNLKVF